MRSCRPSEQTGWHADRMRGGFDFFDFLFFCSSISWWLWWGEVRWGEVFFGGVTPCGFSAPLWLCWPSALDHVMSWHRSKVSFQINVLFRRTQPRFQVCQKCTIVKETSVKDTMCCKQSQLWLFLWWTFEPGGFYSWWTNYDVITMLSPWVIGVVCQWEKHYCVYLVSHISR